MPRSASRYDLYLPLSNNDGHPIPAETFNDVEQRLLARFDGLTAQQRDFPLQGIWQATTGVYLDQVIVMTVLDFHPRGSAQFIANLKRTLLRGFDQIEILITEQSLKVH